MLQENADNVMEMNSALPPNDMISKNIFFTFWSELLKDVKIEAFKSTRFRNDPLFVILIHNTIY